ncbi:MULTISPECIES: hypothetical protein [unclassified Acinetobacter]|uniref:hypothetical protein n=1 Tax=unclassified Acinetobacter TaxID=196816 RepID=UPI00190D1149|nr:MULTISPECIES: hypothetical protein [unclassified Acinetobacter]MBK0062605.1 hypothetical protein [Acinetobacter sp. S55]MBK0065818.1 hypothetical protein [Acinetobacter sp. S54]
MSNSQTKISTVAIGIIQAMQTVHAIYTVVANAMDAAEKANSGQSGADKKLWVLAYARDVVLAMGDNWDELLEKVSTFIDQLKSAYNTVKVLF